LEVLTKNDILTITNLAMLSRINHKRCGAILRNLENLGYINEKPSEGRVYFFLTERGKEFAAKVFDVNNGLHDVVGARVHTVRTPRTYSV
jgi:predicted transcriptional regulator